jgi:hypothetical protein
MAASRPKMVLKIETKLPTIRLLRSALSRESLLASST